MTTAVPFSNVSPIHTTTPAPTGLRLGVKTGIAVGVTVCVMVVGILLFQVLRLGRKKHCQVQWHDGNSSSGRYETPEMPGEDARKKGELS